MFARGAVVVEPFLQRWRPALGQVLGLPGLFLTIFSIAALTGPGRIDIVDGETRYEVSRSLVDHGDSIIRNPHVWWVVFPGRDAANYTYYRIPQSALGVLAIWAADLGTSPNEERRHFFFVLTSAAAGAWLAVVYALCFQCLGLSARSAIWWAAAGILCTPSWFYSTSTFDDILGTAALVTAVYVTFALCSRRPLLAGLLGGLLVGVAYNCKPPLAFGILPVMGILADARRGKPWPWLAFALVVVGLLVGVAADTVYDLAKFPPGARAAHAETVARLYVAVWAPNPFANLVALAFSPSAAVWLYCPTLFLSVLGATYWFKEHRWYSWGLWLGSGVFVATICLLSIFKGDPTWGPRYLTPVFALFWLFVPAASARCRPLVVVALLGAGLLVQGLALSVDSHRLYVMRGLHSAFYYHGESGAWAYFDPDVAHLNNRPREILDIWASHARRAEEFTPGLTPTSPPPLVDQIGLDEHRNVKIPRGEARVNHYVIFDEFRPWWISFRHLAPEQRPVNLEQTAVVLLGLLGIGLAAMFAGLYSDRKP
jgi:hypothetical protein